MDQVSFTSYLVSLDNFLKIRSVTILNSMENKGFVFKKELYFCLTFYEKDYNSKYLFINSIPNHIHTK